ncbi:hypothetical protein ACJMK2_024807 [Sinanodonta woodiana]|uniref:EF-hand domain-containing protein n=1 Tax=Sinanodonta woodiana TaxID=1069815 RepID=A0ABD3XID2_SINWO
MIVLSASFFLRSRWIQFRAIMGQSNSQLSEFQKRKLLHEFHTFFDLNKDGKLEVKDMHLAKKKICEMSGWKPGTEKYRKINELIIQIWTKLDEDGDANFDGRITEDEWLNMWENFNRRSLLKATKENNNGTTNIPDWLEKYIEYKFDLLDRTGDGEIDIEEYEYVMSEFGVPSKDARNAFIMFSENYQKKVDAVYFRELCVQLYRSDDPCALGNFINGRLNYTD